MANWKKEHRASGATVFVKRCGNTRAEVQLNTSTYNLYVDGKFSHRGSAKSMRGAKTAASRRMRCK